MLRALAGLISCAALSSLLLAGCGGVDQSESITARNVDITSYRMQAGSIMPQLVESGVLRIGIDPNHPPFSYYDDRGRLTGFDVEIAEALARHIGLEPHFVELDSSQFLYELSEDNINIAIYKAAPDELLQQFDLSIPYASSSAVILLKSGEENIQAPSDLNGKRVAAPQEARYQRLIEGSNMHAVGYESLEHGIQQLGTGQVEAVLTDSLTYLNLSQQYPQLDVKAVSVTSPLLQSKAMLAKGSDDLLAAINNAINRINADEHYSAIWNKYFSDAPISQ